MFVGAAACWHAAGQGKLVVLGSAASLEGRWLKAVEGNARLADRLFQWLLPVSQLESTTGTSSGCSLFAPSYHEGLVLRWLVY